MHTHTADKSYHAAHTARGHVVHYTSAMSFILSHGHFATITKDGLLAMSTVGDMSVTDDKWYAQRTAYCGTEDDRWLEVPMVFQVDEDGMVSSREVRVWLGY